MTSISYVNSPYWGANTYYNKKRHNERLIELTDSLNDLVPDKIYVKQLQDIIHKYAFLAEGFDIWARRFSLPEIRQVPDQPGHIRLFIDPQRSPAGQRFFLALPLERSSSSKAAIVIMHADTSNGQHLRDNLGKIAGTGPGALILLLERYSFLLTATNTKNYSNYDEKPENASAQQCLNPDAAAIGREILDIAKDISNMLGCKDESPIGKLFTSCQGVMQVQPWITAGIPMPPELHFISPLAMEQFFVESKFTAQEKLEYRKAQIDQRSGKPWNLFAQYMDFDVVAKLRADLLADPTINCANTYCAKLFNLKEAGVKRIVLYYELFDSISRFTLILDLAQQIIKDNPAINIKLNIVNAPIKLTGANSADLGQSYNSHLSTLKNAQAVRAIMEGEVCLDIFEFSKDDIKSMLITSKRLLIQEVLSELMQSRVRRLIELKTELSHLDVVRRWYFGTREIVEVLQMGKDAAVQCLKQKLNKIQPEIDDVRHEDPWGYINQRERYIYIQENIDSEKWHDVFSLNTQQEIENYVIDRRLEYNKLNSKRGLELEQEINAQESTIQTACPQAQFNECMARVLDIIHDKQETTVQSTTASRAFAPEYEMGGVA